MPIVTLPPSERSSHSLRRIVGILAIALVIMVTVAQAAEIGIQVDLGVFKPQKHFAFFTTWASIGSALCAIWILATPRMTRWKLLALGNLAVSAVVVGGVYWGLVKTPGYWYVSSELLLHAAVPITTVLLFLGFSWLHREMLSIRFSITWVAIPLAYAVFVIMVGLTSGWYPYGFLDASKLGWPHTLGMMGALLAGAVVIAYVLSALAATRRRLRTSDV